MNTRTLLFTGLLATAAIAFSGTIADHTGVELTEPVAAQCISGMPEPFPECWSPQCDVARIVSEVTGEPATCTL